MNKPAPNLSPQNRGRFANQERQQSIRHRSTLVGESDEFPPSIGGMMLKRRSAKVMPAELDRIAINHQLGTRYLWSRSVLPAGAVRFILWIAFIGVALLAFATN